MVCLGKAEAFRNMHTRDFALELGFLSVGPVSAVIEKVPELPSPNNQELG
jgi:hypothetical protein